MSWVIIDPSKATVEGTTVMGVDTPSPFFDEIDFEGIIGRAFSSGSFDAWKSTNPIIIVARGAAFEELRDLMQASWGDVGEGTVVKTLMKHCLSRDAVCARWTRDN